MNNKERAKARVTIISSNSPNYHRQQSIKVSIPLAPFVRSKVLGMKCPIVIPL